MPDTVRFKIPCAGKGKSKQARPQFCVPILMVLLPKYVTGVLVFRLDIANELKRDVSIVSVLVIVIFCGGRVAS